jgi:hypothetical protein
MNWDRYRTTQNGGSAPATPGFNAVAPEWLFFYGAAEAAPAVPAAETTLGSHPCVALSSAQVISEWINRSLAVNAFPANGDNPLNFVSHSRGSLQFEPPFPAQHCRNHRVVNCEPHADPLPRHFANRASFAFCIRRAASVSLMCLAWWWRNSALTPSFKYCCQSASEVSFSKGV